MLGKHRLVLGVSYGRLAFDFRARKELIWVIVPPLLLALTFLSMLLLREPSFPASYGEEMLSPAKVGGNYSYSVDWQQTDDGYLSPMRSLR
ncbi:MAG: hypothetical protein HYX94_09870 [Chloroflexi bacterium]|nr:hypothetical protein [Chloroflexota bacterium]